MLSVKSWKSFCESEKKNCLDVPFPDHSEAIICVFFALLSPGDCPFFFFLIKLRKLVQICSHVVAWTSVSYSILSFRSHCLLFLLDLISYR